MAKQSNTVDGSPTKGFVIEILTKDISLIAAILDLVDNSVDSANSLRPDGNLDGITLEITANKSGFSIRDNCGGFDLNHARDYVFRMGRPETAEAAPRSIGQFGIGMKRALFKLGSAFVVESETALERFAVSTNVEEWVKQDQDWSLPCEVLPRHDPERTGTRITIGPLWEPVAAAFSNEIVLAELKSELRSRHRLAIGNGLAIKLNEDLIVAADSKIALSNIVRPSISNFVVAAGKPGNLHVRIVVGVAPTRDKSVEEDAEPEAQSHPAADAGWLVFGNGRLLLANDKSRITGWGSGRKKLPQYHNQYARFRGFVYMTAENAGAIPWNTMKTGVDPDSPIWEKVLEHMIDAARSVIDMLNLAKLERQLGTGDMSTPVSDALQTAVAVDALEVLEVEFTMQMGDLRDAFHLSAQYPEPNPELVEALKKIQYMVQADTFEELAAAVGVSSAAEIGRMSFEAFHELKVSSE